MKDIIDSLTYVLKRERGISVDELRKIATYINYPQWLATLNRFGWENSINLGHSDRAALFPLNVTLLRLNGIMTHRKKFFARSLTTARKVRQRLDLPSSIDLQITSFMTSNIHVNWSDLDEKGKDERYTALWVNFKGSLWKELQVRRDDESSILGETA